MLDQKKTTYVLTSIHSANLKILNIFVNKIWISPGESSQKSCVKSDITILKCPNCQLEFISNDHLTYHFKSYSHKEVISGQYLPKNYNCFVCLKGFDNPNECFEHCQDKSHFQMLSWCGIKSDVQSADNNTSDGDIFETVNSPEKLEEALEAVDSPEEEQISDSDSEHIDNVKVKSENYLFFKFKVKQISGEAK